MMTRIEDEIESRQSAPAAGVSRRTFLQILGAGLVVATNANDLIAQEEPARPGRGQGGGARGRAPANIAARIHVGKDGVITVMTGKVEGGQGSRAEVTQAAAEELRVSPERVQAIMGDTGLCPDDGGTYGSQTTPRTLPAVREAAAGARTILISLAAAKLGVSTNELDARDGKIVHASSNRSVSYGELVGEDSAKLLAAAPPGGAVAATAVKEWKVQGTSFMRPNAKDIVSGGHAFPTDINRPEMLYSKVLRPPSFGAKLTNINLEASSAIPDVQVVRDNDFVGVAAKNLHSARKAIEALQKTATWEEKPQVSDSGLYEHLEKNARGGVPTNPFADELTSATKTLKQTYHVAYAQHAPMEPRAAVAELVDGKLTVWTATQNPFGVRNELQRAIGIPAESVRVIVPDFGGGFGGKHSGECAVEAARLAKAIGKPVWLRWTREEEFMWAYYRPAAVIKVEASLANDGSLGSWHYTNINSGPSGLESPYRAPKNRSTFVQSDSPLRQGSYRGLAGTANHFARESAIDELALLAGIDPLSFRLKHLDDKRMADVLRAAAEKFGFSHRWKPEKNGTGIGLACGTDKGSYVAACAEVKVDPKTNEITVLRVTQAYECGKIVNPSNLMSQVQGAVVQGLGPALREEAKFENGRVTNGTFTDYRVPRFADLPQLQIELLDRPEIPSAGAGETPIMVVAPAIANAVYNAVGVRVRQMPIKLPSSPAA